MVLVLLVIAWAVVLLPAVLRRFTERRRGDSIVDFRDRLDRLRHHGHTGRSLGAHHSLGSLSRPAHPFAFGGPALVGGDVAAARARSRRTQKRRRDVFCGLLAGMVGSAVLALVPGFSALWLLHLVLDVLFVAYVVLLLRARQGRLARSQAHAIGDQLDDLDDDVDYGWAWSHAANE